MIIKHLSLTNFRNYERLELDLSPRVMVLQGGNAQGKSNCLEAIYLLATSKSPRATAERELIHWSAFKDDIPASRLLAEVQRAGGNLRLEIALKASTNSSSEGDAYFPQLQSVKEAAHVQKRIRVNGVPRRAVDLIGQLNVVMFSAEDIDLIIGEPVLRRRYLDITNSQVDHHYLRQLQRYNRVLWQRNHLLRMIAEKHARPEELSFWDKELVESGAYLVAQRKHLVESLNHIIQTIHHGLSDGREELCLVYRGSIGKEINGLQLEQLAEFFERALHISRDKEIARGISLVGPHRDDLLFLINGVDAGVYGSRGQQRTIALSLKLAEAGFIKDRVGENPVLLLDDVLSELDARRRYQVLHSVTGYEQVLLTATDVDIFEPDFLAQAALFRLAQGQIEPLSG
ncbi:DNA replication/repair protein RecF [Chloroflexota bacterium]